MSRVSIPRGAVAAVVALGLSALGPLSAGPSAASPSSLCNKLSVATISATLNVKATSVSAQTNGSVTVCWYKVGANSQAVFVRAQSQDTLAGFNTDRKMAKTQGENPKTDSNFGPYPAFSTSLGSPSYGITYSVTVMKKSTELSLGAVNVTQASGESLAKKFLAML